MTTSLRSPAAGLLLAATALTIASCKPSDILVVPAPAGITAAANLTNQSGAEGEFAGAAYYLFYGLVSGDLGRPGTTQLSALLSDEMHWDWFETGTDYADYGANIDARRTAAFGQYLETQDQALQYLMYSRAMMVLAIPALEKYEPAARASLVGEAFAMLGLTELTLAENWCAGIPLDVPLPNGGVQFTNPLTSDSLLGVAQAHFDSALAHADGVDSVLWFAHVGLGRTLLDRGQFAAADTTVATVPTTFTYNASYYYAYNGTNYPYTFYYEMYSAGGYRSAVNVSEREGTNGLNYVSANDPRLQLDSSISIEDGHGTFYYPLRFGTPPGVTQPILTGLEARMIQAEAALHAGLVSTWASDLNALRADSAETHVGFGSRVMLTPDSTTAASADLQLQVMFRERAFWLYGFGTRLSDMRRLVRQYGLNAESVFPTGAYPNGNDPALPTPLPEYGTDVNMSLPTSLGYDITKSTNPKYVGCLSPAA
jgi:hypothetical protein